MSSSASCLSAPGQREARPAHRAVAALAQVAASADPTTKTPDGEEGGPSWRRSLQHVCVATLTSFLFGYHTGVVNEPLESISADLGFAGPVVSICLGERSSDACLVALLLTELVFSALCVTL
ncbi:hypothetical protein ZWY2020_029189 [Hordeum vulgare]|nr:hypothetical protein ZWY2020_029189 [Hordeum vulgare]